MGALRMYCDRATAESGQMGSPIRFVAATEGIKRDGLNLVISGARLDNYRRNPIVTWAHDLWGRNLPIGRAEVMVNGNQLDADITFDQEDEFARAIESKYRRGYLHAVSVNWDSLSMNGRDVTDWELLEIAAVPVPGDPGALMQRQYQALKELFEPDDEEGSWEKTAAEMVGIFLPEPDDTDEAREKRYKALLPRYRKLGKVAPEWLKREELQGLNSEALRGLFLEGEWETVYGTHERKGAALSQRNRDDLTEAMKLIQGVLERSVKEEPPADENPAEAERSADATPQGGAEAAAMRALQTIFDKLSTIGGQNA